jgi:hypothetical protein
MRHILFYEGQLIQQLVRLRILMDFSSMPIILKRPKWSEGVSPETGMKSTGRGVCGCKVAPTE